MLRINQHDVRIATIGDATKLLHATGATVKLAVATNLEGFAQYSQEVITVRCYLLKGSVCDLTNGTSFSAASQILSLFSLVLIVITRFFS